MISDSSYEYSYLLIFLIIVVILSLTHTFLSWCRPTILILPLKNQHVLDFIPFESLFSFVLFLAYKELSTVIDFFYLYLQKQLVG